MKLSYSPLSSFDFAQLKNDPSILKAIENSTLYIITKRPVLYFENVRMDRESWSLMFEIHQNENPLTLNCRLPLDQEYLFSLEDNPVSLRFWYSDEKFKSDGEIKKRVTGIQFYVGETTTQFRLWLSPEKFMKNYTSQSLLADVEGDVRNFRKYQVLYVGKATDQSIAKRLSNHAKLQEILSLENNISKEELTRDEVVLLLFEIRPELITRSYTSEVDLEFLVPLLKGELPAPAKLTADAEKALIKLLKPHYNQVRYANYPMGTDGLYNDRYDHIIYFFRDELELLYVNATILGGAGGNQLIGKNRKELIIK